MFFEISEKAHRFYGAIAGNGFGDHGPYLAAQGRGEALEDGLQLGGEQAGGDCGGELREEAVKGDEGQEEVAGRGLERESHETGGVPFVSFAFFSRVFRGPNPLLTERATAC